jgi:hypothetical protein
MPTWKIAGYHFYFHAGEPLKKHEPAHIHVRTEKGKVQFWLEKTDTKSKDEIKIKKIKGNISDDEQSKIKKIIKENKDLFLKEWNKRKTKADK